MKNFFLGLWRGLKGRNSVFDWSASCLAALGLTIMLSQQLWDEWLSVSRSPLFVEKASLCFLALLAVFCYEGWQLIRHLRWTGRSIWWIIPLMLFLIGVASPPNWGNVKVISFLAFMVLQLPLFADLYFMRNRDWN
jgi:hypothetical protein